MLAILKPFIAHTTMMAISRITLINNAGIVIFVGSAARLVTNAMPIDIRAIINNTKLLPALTTAKMVKGVRIHPCAAKAMPSHKSLFSCWFLHQFMNKEIKEGFEMLSV